MPFGTFSPFILKVIIDMYDPIVIYFLVLGLFLQDFSFSASYLEKFLQHLLKSWFGGAEFSQLLLVCKASEFSFISELDPCWVQ